MIKPVEISQFVCLSVVALALGCSPAPGGDDVSTPDDSGTTVADVSTARDTGVTHRSDTGASRDMGSTPPADTGTPQPATDSGVTPPPMDTGVTSPPADSGSAPPPVDSGVAPPPVDAGHGPCVPTVAHENTDALCSDGIDNDCNGYTDCVDYYCSRYTRAVTVCRDAGVPPTDSGVVPPPTDSGVTPPPTDAGSPTIIGPAGGTVTLLHFGVFGDVRPPSQNATGSYPTTTITSIMQDFETMGAQFAVASGDFMFANNASAVDAQVTMLLGAEGMFSHHVFHSLGNHECDGASTGNCPLGTETPNINAFTSRLAPGYANPYYDWTIHTSLGDAHFIATAPNAWSPAQQTWLDTTLAVPAAYTFVMAHEPPGERQAPGSAPIETSIAARTGGVTLRLYGHTHEYSHPSTNAIVSGNGGAPLQSTATGFYGFVMVDQGADGNITVSAYSLGSPSTVVDSFVLRPDGSAGP